MTPIITNRARSFAAALLSALLVLPSAGAQTQNAVITGRVTSDAGEPLSLANVYINELSLSVPTNAQGVYTITVPGARVLGQAVNLRVRAIGYQPGVAAIRITAGRQEQNFSLKRDINRLSQVVVTGTIEGTERAKVPFSVSRLDAEDVPVPSVNPISVLAGKVPGMRVSQSTGGPGETPEILMRGPTSINASGRSQSPLIIVDGVIMRVGSLGEIGGLDIESVEVVKGAAGASLYGTTAANGVMIIKTKRGGNQDGIKFNVRSEYGFSDQNSLNYGMPNNHHLQLDETGKRFCITGSGNVPSCSRTTGWMQEIMRINNVNADTTRTVQSIQWNAPAAGTGDLLNVYQSQVWPGQYYNGFAQMSTRNPTRLNSLDATGRMGNVRFFSSVSYTDDRGAFKGLKGVQQTRGRLNLDFEPRNDLTFSMSTTYDQGITDNHSVSLFTLLVGAPAGTDYTVRDTLGRPILRGGGAGLRGSGNGTGAFLYDQENSLRDQTSHRFLANFTATYFPAQWITVEGLVGFDRRERQNVSASAKGYRTTSFSSGTNFGNMSLSDQRNQALNAQISATLRRQLTSDLAGKLVVKGLYDEELSRSNAGSGQQFVVKDVFTLSNTSTNFTTSSSSSTAKYMAVVAGANADYKGRYILDGTFRYDGSSLFGAGNRWAPFGRISGVWRVSEENFWKLQKVSDLRLRASRGTAGNTPNFSAQYETYSCSASGCALGQAGNSKLTPETTTETEVGMDFTLWDRLGIEITHASATTRDQILNVPTPASLGFTSQWQNGGTLQSKTWEASLNLPLISKRDMQWNMRMSFDRTRTYITELFRPEYFTSFFLMSARRDLDNGFQVNRYGNIWGRMFYKTCGDLPAAVQPDCGEGKAFQRNDQGWVTWVGAGNSWRDGITKNLWVTRLPAAESPWNYVLQFGHPIVVRPLRGEVGAGTGQRHALGNTLPDFRLGYNTTFTYKRLTAVTTIEGNFGHDIYNQGEQWGLFDFSSNRFDQSGRTVETAKPAGYGWRVGSPEGVGTGGFYDMLSPNNYSVEDGSYAKIREFSLTYRLGAVRGVGDWTLGLIGRNLATFTRYSGYDPELGATGGEIGSGIINQNDNFDWPTLRTITITLGTRF